MMTTTDWKHIETNYENGSKSLKTSLKKLDSEITANRMRNAEPGDPRFYREAMVQTDAVEGRSLVDEIWEIFTVEKKSFSSKQFSRPEPHGCLWALFESRWLRSCVGASDVRMIVSALPLPWSPPPVWIEASHHMSVPTRNCIPSSRVFQMTISNDFSTRLYSAHASKKHPWDLNVTPIFSAVEIQYLSCNSAFECRFMHINQTFARTLQNFPRFVPDAWKCINGESVLNATSNIFNGLNNVEIPLIVNHAEKNISHRFPIPM